MLKLKRGDGKIKERVVFKFQFHVTRVPQTGWEKLKVSLIPQDTGKRSNKTEKALVEYGCCRWPDPIVESTKLSQDHAQSGRYEDKFYKIAVGTRSKVLGEVTINLADFANVASNSIALPLQNCRGNTLLHAKIYSLTSLKKTRELSVQDNEVSSNSEEEEEELDILSVVTSSTSQALSGPLPKSASSPRETASMYSTDTPLTPKEENGSVREYSNGDPPSPSSLVTSRRRRFSQGSLPSIPPEAQLYRASSPGLQANELAKVENGTPRSVRTLSFRSNSTLELDAPVLEKTVQDLRMEAVTWQRRARAMSLEVQKLKQDLGSAMRQKAGEVPLDKLKLELQSVKQEKEASEQRLRKEVDELQRSITGLKMELAYEKEAGTESNMQLRKAQDSNMQLVLTVQDMEESLGEQRREVEDLSSMNQRLEVSVKEAKAREQNLEKELMSKEEIIKAQQERLENCLNSSREGQNFEDMERELKELTDENMELIHKLNVTTKELESRPRTVVPSLKFEGSPDYEEVDRLKSMIVELEKKLAATEEFHQLQHSRNEKLMSRLKTLIQGLTKTNGDLENQLRDSEQKVQYLSEEFERERAALEEARDRSAHEEGRLNALLLDLKACKLELESRVATLVAQTVEQNRNMSGMLEELTSRASSIKRLEERVLQMEMRNCEHEMKIQDSQELDKLNKLRIHELGTQVSALAKDLQVREESGNELQSKVEVLERELVETSKMLRSEQEHGQQQVDELVSQLLRAKLDFEKSAAVNTSLEEKISSVEKTRQEVELQLGRLKNENIEMMEKLTRIEAEAELLESELENSKKQQSKAQNQVLMSEKQRVAMAAALNEYKSKCIELNTQREKDVHALRELEQLLKAMKAEALDHLAAKEDLSRQVAKLEKSIQALETDNRNSVEKLEAHVTGLKLKNKQVLKRELAIIDELNSVKEELDHRSEQKGKAEHAALKLEKEVLNLQLSLRNSENNYSDLEVKANLLEAECNSIKLAHDKVQETVLLLEAENEIIGQARHELEIYVKTLTDQVASHQRLEECLSNRVSEAEASLKITLEKLETCEHEKAEGAEEVVSYSDRNKTLEAALEQAKSDCMDLRVKMETQRNRNSHTRQVLEMEHEHLNVLLQEYMNSKDELQKRIKGLEEQRNQVEELRENSTARVLWLEAQVAELESLMASKVQENQTLVRSLEAMQLNKRTLERKNDELGFRVAQGDKELKETSRELEHTTTDLLQLTNQMEGLMYNVETLSASNTECTLKLAHSEQHVHLLKLQNEELVEQISELERRAESDEQEIMEQSAKIMALLQDKLRELRAKLVQGKHKDNNVEESLLVETVVDKEQLQGEQDVHERCPAKEVLSRKVQEMQESVLALETAYWQSIQKLEVQVAGLKVEKDWALKRELVIIDELNSVKKTLELRSEQKVEAEYVAAKLEREILRLRVLHDEDSMNNVSLLFFYIPLYSLCP